MVELSDVLPTQSEPGPAHVSRASRPSSRPLEIAPSWDVLGPFQIGTREAPWGADPLERLGGFRNLDPADGRFCQSALGPAGKVTWSKQSIHVSYLGDRRVEAIGAFTFPDVHWTNLQQVFGWPALQYQGWARAEIVCNAQTPQRVAIFTDNVLEFWIDNKGYFGGDFYALRRAPAILTLDSGKHRLDIRLIRDVRSMGAVGEPAHPIAICLEMCNEPLRAEQSHFLLPDLIQGLGFPSKYGSIPLCNTTAEIIYVHDVQCDDPSFNIKPLKTEILNLMPGQSRPLGFQIRLDSLAATDLRLVIHYTIGSSQQRQHSVVESKLVIRNVGESMKTTFLHPSGIVSYCVIIPPPGISDESRSGQKALPLLLNLHGSGVEADSHDVRHQLDGVDPIYAWTIFPSGGSSWCGDDWHTWGFADIEAAIDAIPEFIAISNWRGPGVNIDRWFVVGHSNGGQGTWFALTHRPDKIVAAAPVSGYSSIQNYVNYAFWNEMEPQISMCIDASLANFRHELLLANCAEILIMDQHGSADDNVPPSHSRRLSLLLGLLGYPPEYYEVEGKGHYYKGVMSTTFLRRLYSAINADSGECRTPPERFRLIASNSFDMGSRGGLKVDQLVTSTRLGTIDVERGTHWKIQTSNIRRFHFISEILKNSSQRIEVDEQFFDDLPSNAAFLRSSSGDWSISTNHQSEFPTERVGRQIGALDAVLRTQGAFRIKYASAVLYPIALQISRNLFQYFGADSDLVESAAKPSACQSNAIALSLGDQASWSNANGPICRNSRGIVITRRNGAKHCYPLEKGLGVLFLSPLPNEGLELQIWGHDEQGLMHAARLVPMITGTGQPDFIVVSDKCRWMGAAGVKSIGFFDHDWNVSDASYG